MRRLPVATMSAFDPSRCVALAGFAGALACLAACASGGAAPPAGGAGGAHGAGGGPSGMLEGLDAGAADQPKDAAPVFSCGATADGGATCIQFDPEYPEPATVCTAHQSDPVANAPCSSDGSAGGCHVAAGTSGYTIWWYGRQTTGALIVHCQQLGDSYVSPGFDTTVDASARATGPRPTPNDDRL
ncbi:MAG TPA: hypothetical protein VHH90_03805 [Polyangia bacterium]|nr:hypothetical protein [Polyangia bacterium]